MLKVLKRKKSNGLLLSPGVSLSLVIVEYLELLRSFNGRKQNLVQLNLYEDEENNVISMLCVDIYENEGLSSRSLLRYKGIKTI